MKTNSSLITKKVIAYSFKNIMESTSFEKISIRQIMEDADMRRQTFYDHFLDKYDLLSWIYEHEVAENIDDYLDYEHWEKIIPRLLNYLSHNKAFYLNALDIKGQNSFDDYFFNHMYKLIHWIVLDMNNQQNEKIDPEALDFFCTYHSHAFVGLIKNWLINQHELTVSILASQIIRMLRHSINSLHSI